MNQTLLKALLTPALLLAVACDQMPTDPAPFEADEAIAFTQSPTFRLTTTSGLTALRWSHPLDHDVTVSNWFGSGRRVWKMESGLALGVPSGALDYEEEITVTTRAGTDVAFEFGPHGLEFNKPVTVRILVSALENAAELEAIADASDASRVPLGSIQAVYYAEQGGELIEVIESFPVTLINGTWLDFQIEHFSGYALAS